LLSDFGNLHACGVDLSGMLQLVFSRSPRLVGDARPLHARRRHDIALATYSRNAHHFGVYWHSNVNLFAPFFFAPGLRNFSCIACCSGHDIMFGVSGWSTLVGGNALTAPQKL